MTKAAWICTWYVNADTEIDSVRYHYLLPQASVEKLAKKRAKEEATQRNCPVYYSIVKR